MQRNPRSEPDRIYKYFCELMRRKPGELRLRTLADFNALVDQFYVAPRRKEYFDQRKEAIKAWQDSIDQRTIDRRRSYVKRSRRALSNELWTVIYRLYWCHAAWIILRGESKNLKKSLPDDDVKNFLENLYCYLPQVNVTGWYHILKHSMPMESAYQDVAEWLELPDGDTLRVMLTADWLKTSPPSSLVAASLNSQDLMKKLRRIPPARRTAKDNALIRMIQAEAY